MAYQVERQFEEMRAALGIADGPPVALNSPQKQIAVGTRGQLHQLLASNSASFKEVCDRYLDDPTIRRTPKSLGMYRSNCGVFISIIGAETPVATISREVCRDLLTILQSLPPQASIRWPSLTPREVAAKATAEGIPGMSAANVNCYVNKLSTVFNWAVKEELMARNPARGLRLAEDLAARDKRDPFSVRQLQQIFDAPLYRGCRDDQHGYAIPGHEKPRRARFWIPLIALFTGMRQNEICQLLTADIREIDGVACIAVCAGDDNEKRLKTRASQRLVPVHPVLVRIGLLDYLAERRRAGDERLFPELQRDCFGLFSKKFSVWFARFLVTCGAKTERTCFHSFRHCFRDALREARIDREVALTLGGWTASPGSGGNAVADQYGSGYSAILLQSAISTIAYPELDLSHLHAGDRVG